MQRDPVERAADEDVDLQNVVAWEPRSVLDRFAVWVYGSLRPLARATVVFLALVLLVASLASGLLPAVTDPTVRALVVLSAVPALLLVVYVYRADVTTEPISVVVTTLVLGLLFAPFAGVVNTVSQVQLASLGVDVNVGVASILYFFLVVGIGEELVKLLAVRLYAFRHPRFDAVIDGAVYGAVAGLCFALIENALYITSTLGAPGGFLEVVGVASLRALAGPGHVIYSGVAGYYLGLAKFNSDHAGPLVVKGVLVAATLHATYNLLVGYVPTIAVEVLGIAPAVGVVGFILAYDGLAGYVLYRKLRSYRRAYDATGAAAAGSSREPPAELAEFDESIAGRED